jgi:hypothetical protein
MLFMKRFIVALTIITVCLTACAPGAKLLVTPENPEEGWAAIFLRLNCYTCESGGGYTGGEESYIKIQRLVDGKFYQLPLEQGGNIYATIPAGQYGLVSLITPRLKALFPGYTKFETITGDRVYGFTIYPSDKEVYLGLIRADRSIGGCFREERARMGDSKFSEVESQLFTDPEQAAKRLEKFMGGKAKLVSFDSRPSPARGYSDFAFAVVDPLATDLSILQQDALYKNNGRLFGLMPQDFARRPIQSLSLAVDANEEETDRETPAPQDYPAPVSQ